MFKEMRKKERQIFDNEIEKILLNGEHGVFSTISDNGYPYGVPVNYVYHDKSIFFHCATEGHKLQNIKSNNKVSFCIVSNTEILPDKFSTKYKSVIVFGEASEITDETKQLILYKIIEKYSSEYIEKGKKYIENAINDTKIIKINIHHITGKARK